MGTAAFLLFLASLLDFGYVDSILGDYAYVGDGRIFGEDKTAYLG